MIGCRGEERVSQCDIRKVTILGIWLCLFQNRVTCHIMPMGQLCLQDEVEGVPVG